MLASLGDGAHPALAAAVRAEYASTLQVLDAAFATSKAQFAAARLSPHQWESGHRPAIPAAFPLPTLLVPAAATAERAVTPPARFHPRRAGWRTDYHDDAGAKIFTDLRHVIVIHDLGADGIDAALRLAAARWGTVRIRASEASTQLIAERATALGIATVDSDGRRLSSSRPASPATPVQSVERRPQVVQRSVTASPLPRPPETQRPPRNIDLPERRPSTPDPAPSAEDDIPYEVQLAWRAGRGRAGPPGIG